MKLKFSIVVLFAFLSACTLSPERAASLTDEDICYVYGVHNEYTNSSSKQIAKKELVKRNLITDDEWKLIDQRKIEVGMSECALKASWGPASVNNYTGTHGTMSQYVYKCSICDLPSAYVYTSGGKVTGWSD